MHCTDQQTSLSNPPIIRSFQKRECLPMIHHLLWQIDAGMVRTLTSQEDGTAITLGFWSVGDIIGYPLAGIEPYDIECLSPVQLHRVQSKDCIAMEQVAVDHIHQSQFLLMIRQGSVRDRLQQFLVWLLERFGTCSERGHSMPTRLTHQDIAEAIGTTRVSVTRTIRELAQDDLLKWSRAEILLPNHVINHGLLSWRNNTRSHLHGFASTYKAPEVES